MCEVEDILIDWGLQSLVATFRDNKIDIEVFKKLTPKYIARLIPTVGDQIIFEEKWNLKYSTVPSAANAPSSNTSSKPVEPVAGCSVLRPVVPPIAFDGNPHDRTVDSSIHETNKFKNQINVKRTRDGNSTSSASSSENSSTSNDENSSPNIKSIPKKKKFTDDHRTKKDGLDCGKHAGNKRWNVDCNKKLQTSRVLDIDTDSETEKRQMKKKNKNQRQSIETESEKNSLHVKAVLVPEEATEDSESDNGPNIPSKLKRRSKAFIGHNEFKQRITEEDTLSVKAILEQSAVGKCLLAGYEKNHRLTSKFRKILVDLVISANVFDENSVFRRDQFEYLSSEIVELFPSEVKATYYIPPVPKHLSPLNKSEVAKGKLVDKYRNKIKEYRLLAGVSRPKQRLKKVPKDAQLTEEIEASIQWLKHNRDAHFAEVLEHWERTTYYRWYKLKGSNTSIADHVKEWPILAISLGHKLIEAEFRLLWKDQEASIYTRWSGFFDKVRNLRRLTNPIATLLESTIDDETTTETCKILAQIRLLSYYVPPKGRIQKKRQHWKPSITECQESMLIHVKEPGDIEAAQKARVDKMSKQGLTVQPYIFAVGPSIQETNDFYVAIDQVLYRFDSPLKAFDLCFKSFHVLNAVYPPESEHIYLLIQRAVYRFTTEWDKSIPYIMDIVQEVTK